MCRSVSKLIVVCVGVDGIFSYRAGQIFYSQKPRLSFLEFS
jgi:hypothetical protein